MLLKLVSTVVPVYLLLFFYFGCQVPSLFDINLTDLRNSIRDRLVNTMLVSSQSNIPVRINNLAINAE